VRPIPIPEPEFAPVAGTEVLQLIEADGELERYRSQVNWCKEKAYIAYVEEALKIIDSCALPLADIHTAAIQHANTNWVRFS
jgi:hypothetical protein